MEEKYQVIVEEYSGDEVLISQDFSNFEEAEHFYKHVKKIHNDKVIAFQKYLQKKQNIKK